MIRDITIGQYYPGESVIHRLDPRTKLVFTCLYVLVLFMANNRYMYGLAILVAACYIGLSGIPVKFMAKGIKGILVFIAFSVVMNMFYTKGDPFIDWWIIRISWQGFRIAIYTMIRIILLITTASIITYTTMPTKLTDGLEKAFHWLVPLKVPVHEFAMMINIALRFIPILLEELDKIMKAQQSRGADFESGNVIERLKSLYPVIMPLFISTIRRANDLALAMEARCYRGGEGRTKLYPLKYTSLDIMMYIGTFLYVIAMVWMRIGIK